MNLGARYDAWIATVRDETDRLSTCVATADLDRPVAACPGWDLRRLALHTGAVHRWATDAIEHGAEPPAVRHERPEPDASGADVAAWLRDGVDRLVARLEAAAPDDPTWHPFPAEQAMWFWARRQAHETMVHRWDAEVNASGSSSIDPHRAADGLAEYFDTLLPRVLVRQQLSVPSSSLHVHCTDADLDTDPGVGEWIVWGDDGRYRMEPVHRKGDAAMRGSAEALLLVLMGRADADQLDLVGDRAVVDAWLALPGL